MQVAHCSNEDFSQLIPIPIFVGLALNIFTVVSIFIRYETINSSESDFYKGFAFGIFAFASLYYLLYVVSVVNVLAAILDINVFTVKKKEEKEPLNDPEPFIKEMGGKQEQ